LGSLRQADFDTYDRFILLEEHEEREARVVKQSDRFTLWEVPKSARAFFPTNAQWSSEGQLRPR
jgi:hypothetical protein